MVTVRIFDGVTTDFGKTIDLSGKISSGKIFYWGKFPSTCQNFIIFLLRKFLPRYEKGNILKRITLVTKYFEFSKIFFIYKIPYGRI